MKISAKKYAQALFDLTAGKSKKEAGSAIKEFIRVLLVNNDFSKAEKIIDEFKNICDQKEGVIRAKVFSATELADNSLKLISKYLKEKTGAQKVALEKVVKKDLIGGLIVRYGDRVLDLSLKNRVKELKKKMVH
ncbi:MAG: ATP synthase F1 subunit delta [Candidatus Falkowbacteria bacterium]|jgi:F-type H+-transporting ATPase subunit delta|nr:ATP synthase F1 subunit delta [Candidatus Falkowbacteria bacterium]